MDVSSSTSATQSSTSTAPVDALKKAMQVQEQAIMKVIESADEQSKQVTAQKTGMGSGINLTA